MTWHQWLGGSGQPTGPTSWTTRRIISALDVTNEHLYFARYSGTTGSITFYRLSLVSSVPTLTTFSTPSYGSRIQSAGIVGSDFVVTGEDSGSSGKFSYTSIPVGASPSWTTATMGPTARWNSGPIATPSHAQPWQVGSAKQGSFEEAAGYAKNASKIWSNNAGTYDGVNGAFKAWSGRVGTNGGFFVHVGDTAVKIEFFRIADNGTHPSRYDSMLATSSVSGETDIMQAVACSSLNYLLCPFRDAASKPHVLRIRNDGTRGTQQINTSADLRFGFEFDAGSGAKAWAVNADTGAWWSSADLATWATDTTIGSVPLSGSEKVVFACLHWSGFPFVLTSAGAAYVLEFEVPSPGDTPTTEAFSYRRQRRDESDATAIGFQSDIAATVSASSTATGFAVANVQSFEGLDVGKPWRSTGAGPSDEYIQWDFGAGGFAINFAHVCGRGSANLDPVDNDTVTLKLLAGDTSPPVVEIGTLELSPSTGDYSLQVEGLSAFRYYRLVIESDGSGAATYYQIARAFLDSYETLPTNFTYGFEEQSEDPSEIVGTAPRYELPRQVLRLRFMYVGSDASDLDKWNRFRGAGRERRFNDRRLVPLWVSLDPSGSLATDGHFAPRVVWVRSGGGFRQVEQSEPPVYEAALELVQV